MPLVLVLEKQKQVDLCEFEAKPDLHSEFRYSRGCEGRPLSRNKYKYKF